ncbi:MAG TPA: lmo0937 family membrane protein [Gemmatimonadaceae bacterium]|nr:lmo0937 family membrane protein [Gemmatimonadaceae bacterium]
MRILLLALAVVLAVLWLFGLITAHTMGGLIYILLAVAIMIVLVREGRGRRFT